MPITRSGYSAPSRPVIPAPTSPPWAPNRSYPSRVISSANAAVVRPTSQPASLSGVEKPKPGSDGTTRWKASRGSPPYDAGSDSGPSRSRNSATEPG